MKSSKTTGAVALLASALAFMCCGQALAGGAQIIVVNADGAGEGFNDPTPAAPVGGNTGTTKGQQRLIAFQRAANLWGAQLDSNVPVFVLASFDTLGANVLGSAGATSVFSDFPGLAPGFFYPGVEFPATWYGSALADKRAGVDLNPGFADIRARFSSDFNFYLGLDNNHGAQVDLVTVVLHELGHGLNFQTFVSSATGANLAGQTDTYARRLVDATTGLTWDQMTNAQRQASAVKFGRLVWNGATVGAGIPAVLAFGSPAVDVLSPLAIAGTYQFGTAGFGRALGNPTVSGVVAAALDTVEAGGTSTDGCSPFSNAAAVAGKIVLIERGLCGFAVKARNATNAGAAAAIIYNQAANVNAAPPGMADDGINGAFVTIPVISLTRADGLAILGQLGGGVSASIGVDPNVRAGADATGRARLYAPFPVVAGSSVSHYDTVANRNLLMEPAINGDLTHNLAAPFDLTKELLTDVGWFPDSDLDGVANNLDCNPTSDLGATVVVGGNNSGVPNTLFSSGCSIADLIGKIANTADNHGGFVSGVAALTNQLKASGLISGSQKGAIQSAAARSNIP